MEWHTTNSDNLLNKTFLHQKLNSDTVLVWQSSTYELFPGISDPLWGYTDFRLFSLDTLSGQLTLINELFNNQELIRSGCIKLKEEEDGYVFAGVTRKDINGSLHHISNIFKLNLDFELEWYTELAYEPCVTCTNQIWDMEKAPDGGYVMAGRFRDSSEGIENKSWLVKVDACGDLEYNGCWPVGIPSTPLGNPTIEIYPNPVQDFLHITYPEAFQLVGKGLEGYSLEITNQLGQVVYTVRLERSREVNEQGLINSPINLSTLASGLYSLTLRSEGKVLATEKFVKK